jgi:hypothetical protein
MLPEGVGKVNREQLPAQHPESLASATFSGRRPQKAQHVHE